MCNRRICLDRSTRRTRRIGHMTCIMSSSDVSLFVFSASRIPTHYPRSQVLCFFSRYAFFCASFLDFSFVSFLIQQRSTSVLVLPYFGNHSLPFSMFSLLHLPMSFSTYMSYTSPTHLCLVYLLFSFMFVTHHPCQTI